MRRDMGLMRRGREVEMEKAPVTSATTEKMIQT